MTSRGLPALLLPALLGLAGGALALGCAPTTPASFDECSFVAALGAWDLLAFEPHFPGYPLAVLGARALAGAGASAPYAALAALLLVPAALGLHRGAGGGAGGALAAGSFVLAPPCLREAARPMADASASALLAVALGVAAAAGRGSLRGAALAGLAAGAAAGTKPDLLPWLALGLPLALAARPGARARVALAFGLSAALPLLGATWLAACGTGGLWPLLTEGRRFLLGHLFEWGGAVSAAPEGAGSRLGALLLPGQAWGAPALPGALLLLVLAARAPRDLRRGVVLAGLPYALWMVLGQNPDQPRHALPLLPPLLLLAGAGLARLHARPGLRAALVAALLLAAASASLSQALGARACPRPADALCAWAGELDPLAARVYAGGAGRALRARLPLLDVRRARDLAAVEADLRADPTPPRRVLVLSEVAGARSLALVARLGPDLAVYALGSPPGEDPGR